MIWIGHNMDDYDEGISIDEVIKRIKRKKRKGRGKCMDLMGNPYNPYVYYPLTVRIDFGKGDTRESIILEGLTQEERRMIKKEVEGNNKVIRMNLRIRGSEEEVSLVVQSISRLVNDINCEGECVEIENKKEIDDVLG